MFNIKKRLAVLALTAITSATVVATALAIPAQASQSAGWNCNSYNEWNYVDCLYEDVKGWNNIDHTWYFFRGDGVMEDGWRYIDGSWYDLGNNGAMKIGWLKEGGNWYYLDDSGAMRTGWQQLYGSWYYLFPSSGRMASDCEIDGYHLNTSGAWDR